MTDHLDAIKAKIAKLIRLGEDPAAAGNEAETAMRYAEAMMRKHGLDRESIFKSKGGIEYNWDADFYPFGRPGKPVSKVPDWYQWLIVGVAKFTDTIVSLYYHPTLGAGVIMKGEESDVILSLWFAEYLKAQIRLETRKAGLGSSGARQDFRKAMSLRLVHRMSEMKKERDQVFSSSTALVVVSDKLARRDDHFGGERYRESKRKLPLTGEAAQKGIEAANRVRFNSVIESDKSTTGRIES